MSPILRSFPGLISVPRFGHFPGVWTAVVGARGPQARLAPGVVVAMARAALECLALALAVAGAAVAAGGLGVPASLVLTISTR